MFDIHPKTEITILIQVTVISIFESCYAQTAYFYKIGGQDPTLELLDQGGII
jgi:hypothetical protein